jgi:beta-phosphoglucomutase-like phosphatase (HAD superfamily)
MLHAAIFDMDGLLFDTERLCCEAWRSVSSEAGYIMDDALFFSCVGRNTRDTRSIVMDACGSSFPFDDFDEKARVWMTESMKKNGPPEKPGIRILFDFLSSHSIPIALATSTSEKSARWMIERAGLDSYFSGWAFGSEVERGKPEPDIFQLALSRLNIADPSTCVVFEDSPAGLSAAVSAGMKAVFVPDMIVPDETILEKIWKRIDSLDQAASESFYSDI